MASLIRESARKLVNKNKKIEVTQNVYEFIRLVELDSSSFTELVQHMVGVEGANRDIVLYELLASYVLYSSGFTVSSLYKNTLHGKSTLIDAEEYIHNYFLSNTPSPQVKPKTPRRNHAVVPPKILSFELPSRLANVNWRNGKLYTVGILFKMLFL